MPLSLRVGRDAPVPLDGPRARVVGSHREGDVLPEAVQHLPQVTGTPLQVLRGVPDVLRRHPDRFRGVLALTYDKQTGEENCIGCRLCEYICPPQVIKVEMLKAEKRNFAKTFTLELYACEFCELCVQVCPTDAIIMMKSFDMSTADRRELLLDKDRLHHIGLQFEPSWATGNLLRDMQTPPKAPKAAE